MQFDLLYGTRCRECFQYIDVLAKLANDVLSTIDDDMCVAYTQNSSCLR